MKRLMFLVAFALVASLVFATAAVAQEEKAKEEQVVEAPTGEATMEAELTGPAPQVESVLQQSEQQAEQQAEQPPVVAEQPKMEGTMMESTQPLPKSGGPEVGLVLLPAAALLLGSFALGYAVLRRG